MSTPGHLNYLFSATIIFILFINHSAAQQISAKAVLYDYRNLESPTKLGTVSFTQRDGGPVEMNGVLDLRQIGTSLNNQKRGFHIHTMGDLSDGCRSAQGHYNPFNTNHGAPEDDVRHVGDLGNVEQLSRNSNIFIDKRDDMISLTGPNSIIGRTLVLHQAEDDLNRNGNAESARTGNAGSRIGCGIIGIASPDYTAGSMSYNHYSHYIVTIPLLLSIVLYMFHSQ